MKLSLSQRISNTKSLVRHAERNVTRVSIQYHKKMSDLDRWLEIARDCKYLPENDLKQLCDLVCDLLLEESNIQPVSTPVTVCGDIHGQVMMHKSSPRM